MLTLDNQHKNYAEKLISAAKNKNLTGILPLHIKHWEDKKHQYNEELEKLEYLYTLEPSSFEDDDYLSIPNSIQQAKRGIEVCDIYIQTYKNAL